MYLGKYQERLQDAQEHDETRGLRADREISGDRRGSALVNIRYPDLKWYGCDFETERDENQHHAEERCAVICISTDQRFCDSLQICLAGHPEDPGDSVDEKRCGKRAQHQIFHAGFERERIAASKTDQHVKRNRHQLERDENEDEIDGRHQIHESGACEDWHCEKLA